MKCCLTHASPHVRLLGTCRDSLSRSSFVTLQRPRHEQAPPAMARARPNPVATRTAVPASAVVCNAARSKPRMGDGGDVSGLSCPPYQGYADRTLDSYRSFNEKRPINHDGTERRPHAQSSRGCISSRLSALSDFSLPWRGRYRASYVDTAVSDRDPPFCQNHPPLPVNAC